MDPLSSDKGNPDFLQCIAHQPHSREMDGRSSDRAGRGGGLWNGKFAKTKYTIHIPKGRLIFLFTDRIYMKHTHNVPLHTYIHVTLNALQRLV